MRCPTCKLELGVEHRVDERCPSPDDPVLCGNILPTVLVMLTEGKITPLRTDEPHATGTQIEYTT